MKQSCSFCQPVEATDHFLYTQKLRAASHFRNCATLECYLLKSLSWSSHHLNSKNNGPVYLFETKFRHLNFFLSSIATNGKDKYGLKLRKIRSHYFVILWADLHWQTNLEWYLNIYFYYSKAGTPIRPYLMERMMALQKND